MDKLSYMISEVMEKGDWIDIKADRWGSIISHLNFVDDLLIFGKETRSQMHCVKIVLNNFSSSHGKELALLKL